MRTKIEVAYTTDKEPRWWDFGRYAVDIIRFNRGLERAGEPVTVRRENGIIIMRRGDVAMSVRRA